VTGIDTGFCRAVSQHGKPVTAYIAGRAITAKARPGRDFVCTRDAGHAGGHSACDGNGHILARWARSAVERYGQPGGCEGHGHSPADGKGQASA
jgi:hypothetical protein